MTDYNILFIDDYSKTADLDASVLIGKWERTYSEGILEQRLEKYDLVFLDLETGKTMEEGAPAKISRRVSKERFYITVPKEEDKKDVRGYVLEWGAQSYFAMPMTHERIVLILESIGAKGENH